MSVQKLKQNLIALEMEDDEELAAESETELEILCDSVSQALRIASRQLKAPIDQLDYQIIQKGSSGILGIGKTPYRILINLIEGDGYSQYSDLDGMNVTLGSDQKDAVPEVELNKDGKVLVRIYKSGIFLTVKPPNGMGLPVDIHTVKDKIRRAGAPHVDEKVIERAVKQKTGEPVKIGQWVPQPDADSTISIEVAPDEMASYVNISAPRPGGRHLTVSEIVQALKHFGVVSGYQEDVIEQALDDERYGQQIPGAKGKSPEDGQDGYVDYKVKIDKKVEFQEDEKGRVDFLSKGLVENVVQGQLLAQLMPAKKGQPGQTVTGKLMPAKNGKNIELKPGQGTILSDDRTRLMAEKNGQVVYTSGKINVEEIYKVGGDVGLDTGNIMFLGSVVVTGSVSDNMQVKAAGNIEVGGSVQKSHVEAEGDVIIRGGVQGRDGARIESTTGSVFAKFIQNANVSVEKDAIVSEAIMHSKIQAVGKVHCNGRRAQIVGGEILAGEEVRVKQLGAQASTPTTVVVGINPKILQQQRNIEAMKDEAQTKLQKAAQNIRTLKNQKATSGGNLSSEKEEMLVLMLDAQEKLQERLQEIQEEKQQLDEHVSELSQKGAVHVEKTLYPGVTVEINNARFVAKDEYTRVTLIEEKGNIKIIPYKASEESSWRKRSLG